MTESNFKSLKKEEKVVVVYEEGVYIDNRIEPEYTVQLYQMESFYVELFYHARTKEVVYARSFSSTDELNPYLKKIDIISLFNR